MNRSHNNHAVVCRSAAGSLLIALLAAVPASRAQEQAPAAETAVPGLQEVVVTAIRRE